MYQTEGEEYLAISLRSVPDQNDLTPSDLPARGLMELEQVRLPKDFAAKLKSKEGLDGFARWVSTMLRVPWHGRVVGDMVIKLASWLASCGAR